MAQHYDNAVKYMMIGYSQEFVEFIAGHSNIKVLEVLETEQPTVKSHQNDSTLKVQLQDETVIFHTEVQTDNSRKPMWCRLAGYNGYLIQQHEMPVYCNVLYLHPNAGRNDKGYYTYKRMGYEYLIKYKVIRLIEIDGQSVLEKQIPGLLPFTPLMKPTKGMENIRWLEKCIDTVASISIDQNTRNLLYSLLGVFGGLVYEPEVIQQRLPEGIMQESPYWQYCIQQATAEVKQIAHKEGREEGIKEGIKDNIMSLLETQFQPDDVQALKPSLERIDDMQHLKELLLSAPRVDSLEMFKQYIENGSTIESENGRAPRP